ncbi:MAG: hypothetical protein VKO00_05810 [Cyanobacteriota bacterium]|nr:hypothetical protein [Cyanobacteriota bacterium]
MATGLLAGVMVLGSATAVLACGGGGSGSYRKPARPMAPHHAAPQSGGQGASAGAKDPSAGS